jgi:hypothetical protein
VTFAPTLPVTETAINYGIKTRKYRHWWKGKLREKMKIED